MFVEYAKATPDDILIRITVVNRGPEAAPLHLLPTVWFRNTWSWGYRGDASRELRQASAADAIELDEPYYGQRWLYCEGAPELLFTENESDNRDAVGHAERVTVRQGRHHRLRGARRPRRR